MRRASVDAGTVAALSARSQLPLPGAVCETCICSCGNGGRFVDAAAFRENNVKIPTGFENAVAKHAPYHRIFIRALHSHRKAESLHIKKSKASVIGHCFCDGFQITVFYRSVRFIALHSIKTYKHAYDVPLPYPAVLATGRVLEGTRPGNRQNVETEAKPKVT